MSDSLPSNGRRFPPPTSHRHHQDHKYVQMGNCILWKRTCFLWWRKKGRMDILGMSKCGITFGNDRKWFVFVFVMVTPPNPLIMGQVVGWYGTCPGGCCNECSCVLIPVRILLMKALKYFFYFEDLWKFINGIINPSKPLNNYWNLKPLILESVTNLC